MAFEFPGQIISMYTTENLKAKQYYPIDIDTDGRAVLAVTSGGYSLGVLQNTPTSGGGACSVMVSGVSKAAKISTGIKAINERAAITVGSTASGFGPTTGKGYILGRAITAIASGSTGLFSLFITHEGFWSTAAFISVAS